MEEEGNCGKENIAKLIGHAPVQSFPNWKSSVPRSSGIRFRRFIDSKRNSEMHFYDSILSFHPKFKM